AHPRTGPAQPDERPPPSTPPATATQTAQHQLSRSQGFSTFREPTPPIGEPVYTNHLTPPLPTQRAAALHIQRLIDRLVRHPHRHIVGEVELQPPGDLFRAP